MHIAQTLLDMILDGCYTFIADGPGGDFDCDIMNGPGGPIKFLEGPGALDVKVGGPGGSLLDMLGGPGGLMEEPL